MSSRVDGYVAGSDRVATATVRQTIPIAIVAVLQRGGVLLRARPANDGLLSGLLEMPGGKVELFEAPTLAAARELEEETGLRMARGAFEPLLVSLHRYPDRALRFHVYVHHLGQASERAFPWRELRSSASGLVAPGGDGVCAISSGDEASVAGLGESPERGEWAFWPVAQLRPADLPEANRAWLPLLRSAAESSASR